MPKPGSWVCVLRFEHVAQHPLLAFQHGLRRLALHGHLQAFDHQLPHLVDIVGDVRASMLEETDFRKEAENVAASTRRVLSDTGPHTTALAW